MTNFPAPLVAAGGMEDFLAALIKRRATLVSNNASVSELQQLDERITEMTEEIGRTGTITCTLTCRRWPPCKTCGTPHNPDKPTYYTCGFPCDNCGTLHNPNEDCTRPLHLR